MRKTRFHQIALLLIFLIITNDYLNAKDNEDKIGMSYDVLESYCDADYDIWLGETIFGCYDSFLAGRLYLGVANLTLSREQKSHVKEYDQTSQWIEKQSAYFIEKFSFDVWLSLKQSARSGLNKLWEASQSSNLNPINTANNDEPFITNIYLSSQGFDFWRKYEHKERYRFYGRDISALMIEERIQYSSTPVGIYVGSDFRVGGSPQENASLKWDLDVRLNDVETIDETAIFSPVVLEITKDVYDSQSDNINFEATIRRISATEAKDDNGHSLSASFISTEQYYKVQIGSVVYEKYSNENRTTVHRQLDGKTKKITSYNKEESVILKAVVFEYLALLAFSNKKTSKIDMDDMNNTTKIGTVGRGYGGGLHYSGKSSQYSFMGFLSAPTYLDSVTYKNHSSENASNPVYIDEYSERLPNFSLVISASFEF